MTLPSTWPTVPVFGTYLRIDGTPNEGSVWFETSQRVVIVDGTGLTIGVVPRRIIATLDANGYFALDLPCTDAGGQPTGWTWQVYERFNSGQPVYSIEVPQALSAQGINLAQYPHAVPVPVAPPVVSYLTTADIGVTVADQVGVDNAISTANAAATTASAAQAAAASAVTTANAASATANAIDGKAQSALDNSNAAVTTANTASATATAAQNTANAIDGKAQSALDNSNAAVTTANAASVTATAAQNTANAIDGKAQSALDASAAATTTANTASATANAIDGKATSALAIAGAMSGFKNLLINGNFDWWQRRTSMGSGVGSGYCADRWTSTQLGSTRTVSQQAFVLGQTAVPNEPAYFHRVAVTSVAGAGNAVNAGQQVESVRRTAGRTVTLSFWAKADAPKNMAVEFYQTFGTGGSPSALVTGIGVTTIALTTAWQKFSVTAAIPSIAGKTLGTSNNDGLVVSFWFDAGSSFNARTNSLGQQSGTFDIAQVQLETAAAATQFEMRPIETEFALCQRYCLKLAPGIAFGLFGLGMWGSTTVVNLFVPTPTSMRATPTVTLNGSINVLSTGNVFTNVSSAGASSWTAANICIALNMASSGTTGNSAQVNANNDATASITLDCDL